MAEVDTERAKILGELIREAREHMRRSVEECAAVLGISQQSFEQVEAGEYLISLPELEALALYLEVPMGYFWGSESLHNGPDVDYGRLLELRHRVIGVLLSQLRLRAKKSQEDVAAALELDLKLIQAYETGDEPVPYLHLEQLCQYFNTSVDHFLDDLHGPLGRHEAQKRFEKQFNRMSPEMQAFLVNPVNVSYLETAKKLSEMDVQKLRQVAENILDITF
jgi:transcriptional regulator with XRE-family HTH domain